jgi:hypothetical protein
MDWLACYFKYSPIIALVINFAGAILLLFSTGAHSGGGVHWASTDERGRSLENMYFLSPGMFKWGMGLIAAGFLIQLINEAYQLRNG